MRKFNIEIFKEYLNKEIRLRRMKRSTADVYVRKLQALNDSLPEDYTCADLADRIDYLSERSGHSMARIYINAVKKYESGVIGSKGICLYGEALSELYRKYPRKGVVELRHAESVYRRKVNAIPNRDMGYKLAFRLQMASGLRVAEVAKLQKRDLQIEEEPMQVQVWNGKGGKDRLVTMLPDPWLQNRLREYMKDAEADEHVFADVRKLKAYAQGMNMKTHDLRKIYARTLFRTLREEGQTMAQARKEVSRQLGHSGTYAGEITNLYLGKEWTYGRKQKQKP